MPTPIGIECIDEYMALILKSRIAVAKRLRRSPDRPVSLPPIPRTFKKWVHEHVFTPLAGKQLPQPQQPGELQTGCLGPKNVEELSLEIYQPLEFNRRFVPKDFHAGCVSCEKLELERGRKKIAAYGGWWKASDELIPVGFVRDSEDRGKLYNPSDPGSLYAYTAYQTVEDQYGVEGSVLLGYSLWSHLYYDILSGFDASCQGTLGLHGLSRLHAMYTDEEILTMCSHYFPRRKLPNIAFIRTNFSEEPLKEVRFMCMRVYILPKIWDLFLSDFEPFYDFFLATQWEYIYYLELHADRMGLPELVVGGWEPSTETLESPLSPRRRSPPKGSKSRSRSPSPSRKANKGR